MANYLNFDNIVLFTRDDIDEPTIKLVTAHVEQALEALIVSERDCNFNTVEDITTDPEKMNSNSLVLSVGGDGTFLAACRKASNVDATVAGINMGRRGFLPEIELDDMTNQLLSLFLDGRTSVRSTITVKNGQIPGKVSAINDIFITMPGKYTGEFAIDINGSTALKFIGEGVVVNTPTGSTAMAITAGGSIMHPQTKALQIVPINAHALHARPITVDDNSVITIRFARKPANEAEIFFDGISYKTTADSIDVRKSKNIYILKTKEYDFFQRVIERMYSDIEYSV